MPMTDEEFEKFKNGAIAVNCDGFEHTYKELYSEQSTYIKQNWSLKPILIHHIEMLREFLKEAEVNPKPREAFEISYNNGAKYEPLEGHHSLAIFEYTACNIRRKKKPVIGWQWVYTLSHNGKFGLTSDRYATREEAKADYVHENVTVLYPIKESEGSIDE